jgi:hypothetical protein
MSSIFAVIGVVVLLILLAIEFKYQQAYTFFRRTIPANRPADQRGDRDILQNATLNSLSTFGDPISTPLPTMLAPVNASNESMNGDARSERSKRRVAVAVTMIAGREAPTSNEELDFEGFVDSAGVLAQSVRTFLTPNSMFEIDIVALVLASSAAKLSPLYPKLRKFGLKIVEEPPPVRFDEIAESYYKENVNKSGCCGLDEVRGTFVCVHLTPRLVCETWCAQMDAVRACAGVGRRRAPARVARRALRHAAVD